MRRGFHNGRPCTDERCDFCERQAERCADDHEPDYNTDAAADQYERSIGYV